MHLTGLECPEIWANMTPGAPAQAFGGNAHPSQQAEQQLALRGRGGVPAGPVWGGGVEGGAGGFAPEEAKRLGKEESPFTKFEDTPQTSFPTLKSERYRPAFSSESSSSCHMCDKKTLKHTCT